MSQFRRRVSTEQSRASKGVACFDIRDALAYCGKRWRWGRCCRLGAIGRIALATGGSDLPGLDDTDGSVDEKRKEQEAIQAAEALAALPVALHARGKTDDGSLIQATAPAMLAVIDALTKDPHALHAIGWRYFEEVIAAALSAEGYTVILTPRSGDFGRDVIAKKDGLMPVRLLGQVKKFAPENPVTVNDVRALVGLFPGDAAASHGLVATTSYFAPKIADDPCIKPLGKRLRLMDGVEVARWICGLRSQPAIGRPPPRRPSFERSG